MWRSQVQLFSTILGSGPGTKSMAEMGLNINKKVIIRQMIKMLLLMLIMITAVRYLQISMTNYENRERSRSNWMLMFMHLGMPIIQHIVPLTIHYSLEKEA